MKKTLVKSIALGAVIFCLGTASVFADGKRFARPNLPQQKNEKSAPSKKMPAPMGLNRTAGGMANRAPKKAASPKVDVFGTVSAVSSDSKILTVKDADGKETQIHVNPLTRVNAIPSQAERAKKLEERKTADKNQRAEKKTPPENAPARLTLSDVKVGDWVMVQKLGGETKTLEAGKITVARD